MKLLLGSIPAEAKTPSRRRGPVGTEFVPFQNFGHVLPVSNRPASGDQVEDEQNDCQHKQQVDQASGNMQAEAKDPQYKQDYKDRPKHT